MYRFTRKPSLEDIKVIYSKPFPTAKLSNGKIILVDEFKDLVQIHDAVEGAHYFGVRHSDADDMVPATIEDKVVVNRFCSILSKDDLLDEVRKNPPKAPNGDDDIFLNLSQENRNNIYDGVYGDPDEHDPSYPVEMTIEEYLNNDEEEFNVVIEEHYTKTFKVKAKSIDEALAIGNNKYMLDMLDMSDAEHNATLAAAYTSDYGEGTDFEEVNDIVY